MAASIPKSMQAIAIERPGGPEVLQLVTSDVPQTGPHDVLIRVNAAGVNRPDCLQRLGKYRVPADASPLPGLEVAGVVVATGPAADKWRPGDAVMALTHGGGYAEYCRVNERHCIALPDTLSFVEAAAIPETFFTVWYNVFTSSKLAPRDVILVHGGSSGIGTTTIQLAKSNGCTVITTAGSDTKCQFCEDLGADLAINYRSGDWVQHVLDYTEGRGVDVLLDMVAGPYMQKNIDVMANDGRYCIIAFQGGTTAELNMRAVVVKRIQITGSTLRPQSDDEKAAIADALQLHVLPLLESGTVKPIIHSTFRLEHARAAHELMESSKHMGKIVLQVTTDQ